MCLLLLWPLFLILVQGFFIKSQIWLVMPFFVLFYLLQWKPMRNKENWRQTASQAASLRAHFWSSYKDFHQKLDMTGHAVFCFILLFPMNTNEKQRKMTPDSEPGSQLESWFLILVQGISSKVRYDWSCRFLFYITFYNENKPKTKKHDARQRARQAACLGLSYGLPHAGPPNEEI